MQDKELKQKFPKHKTSSRERANSGLYELAKSENVEFDTHCHFFNNEYIPEKYLKLRFPLHSKKFLDNTEKFLDMINPFSDTDKMSYFAYFMNFIRKTSPEIADYFINIHSPNTIFCPLLMDMTQGIKGEVASLTKQMDDMKLIMNKYPNQILPFIAIDPNNPDAKEIFIKAFSDEYNFFGVKIYPSLGYLPSHPILMDIFDICQEKGIPVVTHCGGDSVHTTEKRITSIFLDYDSKNRLIKHTEKVKFQTASDYGTYFNSPSKWEPVLRTFPNLKLNFGHFGGSSHWLKLKVNNIDNKVLRIIDLMLRYKNVYSDVSYSLSDPTIFSIFVELYKKNKILRERTLFGSDFFMVVTEGKYKNMRTNFKLFVGDDIFRQITTINPKKFLFDL